MESVAFDNETTPEEFMAPESPNPPETTRAPVVAFILGVTAVMLTFPADEMVDEKEAAPV